MSEPIDREPSMPRAGQRWRRKKDGVLTTILSVTSLTIVNPEVIHQAQRRTHTQLSGFLAKYEFVEDAPSSEAQAADAPNPNITREGVLVAPGQRWEDLDKRMHRRVVVVEAVHDGKAKVCTIYTTKRTTISVSRMHRHSTGFRLLADGEYRLGAWRDAKTKES